MSQYKKKQRGRRGSGCVSLSALTVIFWSTSWRSMSGEAEDQTATQEETAQEQPSTENGVEEAGEAQGAGEKRSREENEGEATEEGGEAGKRAKTE
jgi:hypothetical protein